MAKGAGMLLSCVWVHSPMIENLSITFDPGKVKPRYRIQRYDTFQGLSHLWHTVAPCSQVMRMRAGVITHLYIGLWNIDSLQQYC